MDLCRLTSRILKTEALRRAALVRNPARREWAAEIARIERQALCVGLYEVAVALIGQLCGGEPAALGDGSE
jgi:hypothetical protein